MKTINVEEINFSDNLERQLSKNYPNSGLFISKLEGGTSDFVFVDKKVDFSIFLMPASIVESFFDLQEKPLTIDGLNKTTELIQESIKYDGDFILEFARILLNRK